MYTGTWKSSVLDRKPIALRNLRGDEFMRLIVLMTVLLITLQSAVSTEVISAEDEQGIRNDALVLKGATVLFIGMPAYCLKYVGHNQDLLDAAGEWIKRHRIFQEKIFLVIKKTGGMSAAKKEEFDKTAFRLVKEVIESGGGKKTPCNDLTGHLNSGDLDLDKNPELKDHLQRVMDFR